VVAAARRLALLDTRAEGTESRAMTKTKRTSQSVALDPVKAELLAVLSKETRIPRAELLREAVDDLLAKYLRRASQGSK
jgi:Ribbon-helix-helix domain